MEPSTSQIMIRALIAVIAKVSRFGDVQNLGTVSSL